MGLIGLKGRWIKLPDPLLARKWIHLVDPVLNNNLRAMQSPIDWSWKQSVIHTSCTAGLNLNPSKHESFKERCRAFQYFPSRLKSVRNIWQVLNWSFLSPADASNEKWFQKFLDHNCHRTGVKKYEAGYCSVILWKMAAGGLVNIFWAFLRRIRKHRQHGSLNRSFVHDTTMTPIAM